MFERFVGKKIIASAKKYRAIALVGPRQSGKTTLAKAIFPGHEYISLENPDIRLRAISDPRSFISNIKASAILDEVQNSPDLFSYLQEVLDDKKDTRQFILTGSNSFQLNEKIAQSLAGRIRIFHVLPLLRDELPVSARPKSLNQLLITGLYPRIYDEALDPYEWFSNYYQTYLQKDIKSILNVSDSIQFDRFVRMCAGRSGQLGDYSAIASEVGISQPTAVRWTSVLESSYITFRLAPHFKNFNKKIIKTPKLYFYDTGLLCQLLKITSTDQLAIHPMRGSVFENYVVSEAVKTFHSVGLDSPAYFWRDQHGHEIDLIIDSGGKLIPFEIKSGATFQESWLKNLDWFGKLQPLPAGKMIYGGEQSFDAGAIRVLPWHDLYREFLKIARTEI